MCLSVLKVSAVVLDETTWFIAEILCSLLMGEDTIHTCMHVTGTLGQIIGIHHQQGEADAIEAPRTRQSSVGIGILRIALGVLL